MKILVINAGSSSLKYQLINMEDEKLLAKGNCDRIGIGGHIVQKADDGRVEEKDADFPTHMEAFEEVTRCLMTGKAAVISDVSEIAAIGHRVVQGAEKFSESVRLDEAILSEIESLSELAPLHNPPAVVAIKACMKVFGSKVPQVAVFDTAFHQTLPKKAYMFAVPYEYYEKHHIRRYGFHGTSHRYVSKRVAKLMGRDVKDLKIVTCHLGNGSSITAVDGGKSVDTSMGFTPLDGLIMGTRCGGIDPSIVTYIAEKENKSPQEMSDLLNKESGYLGISGLTSDDRDLRAAADAGNERCALAGQMQRYQIKKFIGAYAAAMGGLDAVVFTGGIGENSAPLRRDVCKDMQFLGIEIDEQKNLDLNGKEVNLSLPGAKVQVWIVPTDEELVIARDTESIVSGM